VLAIWNYVPPRETGQPKTVHLQFRSSERAPERARIHLVDDDHGSPFHGRRWGVLIAPGLEQQAFLRKAAELPSPTSAKVVEGKLSVSLQPNALAVVEFDAP
jgi:hypothetical protein